MKKSIILLLALVIFLETQAQKVAFEPSLSKVFEKAVLENKMVFVKHYNSDCPVCLRLEPFWENPEVVDFYNKNFVSYALDTKHLQDEEKELLEKANLHFVNVPNLVFFDKNKNFAHYSYTQEDAAFLIKVGKDALSPTDRGANLAAKYEKGDRSIRTLYAYNTLLQIQQKDSLARVVAADLYEVFPKSNLASKKSFNITKDCVTDVDNGFFVFWIENMKDATFFYPIERVKSELGNIIFKSIYQPNRAAWRVEKISKVKNYVLKTGLSANPDVFFWQEESKVLCKQGQEKEAFALANKMWAYYKNDENASKLFLIGHFAALYQKKQHLRVLDEWLKTLSIKAEEKEEKADFYYLKSLVMKKYASKKDFKAFFREAKTYYEVEKLDMKLLQGLEK
ncbi:MAG: thioredoxin family protein [Thermonemataceae bacterium]|nr:thioredoxin family protein [Thermonemataceae bacterium]